jgi:hypothetical protein
LTGLGWKRELACLIIPKSRAFTSERITQDRKAV